MAAMPWKKSRLFIDNIMKGEAMIIKSDKLYSAENYLREVTSYYYINHTADDLTFINKVLKENGLKLRSFALAETNKAVETDMKAVLVDCWVYNKKIHGTEHKLRWYEVLK